MLWTTFKPVQVVFEKVFLLSCKVYKNGVRRLETYTDVMQFSRLMQQLASTIFDKKKFLPLISHLVSLNHVKVECAISLFCSSFHLHTSLQQMKYIGVHYLFTLLNPFLERKKVLNLSSNM